MPAPVPTAGIGRDVQPSFVHGGFVGVWPLGGIPDFGRFYGSRGGNGGGAALAKNLPHRSRENEFTDGRGIAFLRRNSVFTNPREADIGIGRRIRIVRGFYNGLNVGWGLSCCHVEV